MVANHDLNKTQEITKEEVSKGKVSLDLDTELITDPGKYVTDAAKNLMNLGKNIPKAVLNYVDPLVDTTVVAGSVIEAKMNLDQGGQTLGKAQDVRQDIIDTQIYNETLTKEINKGISDKDATQLTKTLSETDKNFGGNGKAVLYDSEQIAAAQQKAKNSDDSKDNPAFISKDQDGQQQSAVERTVYYNANPETGTDLTNGSNIVGNTIHEEAHRAGMNEAQSNILGNIGESAWAKENFFNGYTTGSESKIIQQQTQQAWVNNEVNSVVIQKGTDQAAGVEDFEAKFTLIVGKKTLEFDYPKDRDMIFNTNSVVEPIDNALQKVPQPVVDIAAITAGTITFAALTGGASLLPEALVVGASVVGSTATGLTLGKITSDYLQDRYSFTTSAINAGTTLVPSAVKNPMGNYVLSRIGYLAGSINQTIADDKKKE